MREELTKKRENLLPCAALLAVGDADMEGEQQQRAALGPSVSELLHRGGGRGTAELPCTARTARGHHAERLWGALWALQLSAVCPPGRGALSAAACRKGCLPAWPSGCSVVCMGVSGSVLRSCGRAGSAVLLLPIHLGALQRRHRALRWTRAASAGMLWSSSPPGYPCTELLTPQGAEHSAWCSAGSSAGSSAGCSAGCSAGLSATS